MIKRLLVCALLFIVACKSSQWAGEVPLPETALEICQRVQSNHHKELKYYRGKASVNLDLETESLSLKAQVRLVKDSAIWMSISPGLGIELARALITPDTLILLNRLDKTVQASNFSKISSLLGSSLTYSQLQAIVLGELAFAQCDSSYFWVENKAVQLSNLSEKQWKKLQKGKWKESNTVWNLGLSAALTIRSLSLQDLAKGQRMNLSILSYHKDEGAGAWPKDLRIDTYNPKGRSPKMEISWGKPRIDQPFRISFSVPDNYVFIP